MMALRSFRPEMLTSASWFIQECVEDMASRGHGSMTFLASIAGISGNGAIGTYGITKAANAHLAKNMAIEWGPKGIRSNAIAPGRWLEPNSPPNAERAYTLFHSFCLS